MLYSSIFALNEDSPDNDEFLQPLNNVSRYKLILVLTKGRSCLDDDQIQLSLPVQLGGLGNINPSEFEK